MLSVAINITDNWLNDHAMEIGEPNSKALKMPSSEQRKGSIMNMRKCYHASTKYLTSHLRILNDLAARHPLMHKEAKACQAEL